MDLTFKDLRCPNCGETMEVGGTTVNHPVVLTARRCSCTTNGTSVVLVITPLKDNYTVTAKKEKAQVGEYYDQR